MRTFLTTPLLLHLLRLFCILLFIQIKIMEKKQLKNVYKCCDGDMSRLEASEAF